MYQLSNLNLMGLRFLKFLIDFITSKDISDGYAVC